MGRTGVALECSVEVKRQEWELTLEGEPVLHCVLTQPVCTGTWKGLEAINRCYRHAAEIWRRRWERELYCMACLDLADRRARGKPFRPWQARLTTQITYQGNGVLSLFQDGTEQAGYDRPLTVRRGDTWDLQTGAPQSLARFCSGQRHWKRKILEQVCQQMQMRLAQGESLLDTDCIRKRKKYFREDCYYLTSEGANVFFPMYAIAPGAEGIPTFCVTLPDR